MTVYRRFKPVFLFGYINYQPPIKNRHKRRIWANIGKLEERKGRGIAYRK